MRIHTKVVVRMTAKVGEYIPVSEEGFDYDGPIASCDPATIALVTMIATVAASGTTAGLAIDSALNQPGQPKLPTTATPLTASQNAQTTSAVSQQLPTLQSLTGGSLSPEYGSQFGSIQAGVANNPQAAGDIQAALNQFYGLSAPGSTGLTTTPGGVSPGGGNPIMDLLTKAKPASTPDSGGGGSDFINSLLSGNDFKGLVGA